MPNDQNPPSTPPDSNQMSGSTPPTPPATNEDVPFPITDLPPLSDTAMPIENQVMANAPQTPGTPPPFDIPPVVTPLTKKGWSGGKIVGAVLGLLLLVGGVGAGILLVRQNQDIREKASTAPGCTAVGGPSAQCYPSDTSCTGTNYGAVDCGTGRKCATGCTTPPPGSTACQPGQERTENCIVNIGSVPGSRRSVCTEAGSWGPWSTCVPGGNIPSPTPSQTFSCVPNGGSCFSAAGGCVSIGRSSVNGTCSGGQVCCSNAVGGGTPTPTPGGGATPTPTPTPTPVSGPTCPNDPSKPIVKYVKFTCPGGCRQTTENGVTAYRCYDNRDDSNTPLSLDGACGQVDALSGSADSSYCGYTQYTCGEPRCQGGGGSPVPTSTPTSPSPAPTSPTCQQVLAYDTNWNALSRTQLSNLRAGEKVRFTINGTRTTGAFTKARFKINSQTPVEVTTTKPGQSEVFYTEYTIPTGTSTFTINAAIYHNAQGWIPNDLTR